MRAFAVSGTKRRTNPAVTAEAIVTIRGVLPLADTTSLDIATAVVAGYAAIIGTLALGFQIFEWATTWRTRVAVDLSRMTLHTPGSPGAPDERIVLFRMTNHSGHKVTVTHLSIEPVRRKGPHLFIPHPLPQPIAGSFDIPARDSATRYISPNVIADKEHDPKHRTRATITTSDGRTFRSNKVRVRDLIDLNL